MSFTLFYASKISELLLTLAKIIIKWNGCQTRASINSGARIQARQM